MSIECKPASSSLHKQDGVHGKGGKGKSTGAEAAQDGGGNGFMAILSAQEEVTAESTSTPPDANASALQTPQSPVPDSDPTAQKSMAGVGALTQSAALTDVTAQDPKLAVASTDGLGRALPGLPGSDKGSAVESDLRLVPDGNAADSALSTQMQRAVGGKGVGVRSTDGAVESPTDTSVTGLGKDFRRMLAKAKSDKAADATELGGQVGSTAAPQGAREARDVKLMAAMDIQRLLQPAAQDEAVVLPTLARDEKRVGDRSVFAAMADTQQTTAAQPTSSAEYNDLGFSAVTEVAAPPEVQVAEQVQFWISQDVQSAEMQLEGLGDKPVEVSITMHGNEAHVAFRSDELLARGVLEGAEKHLREMLGREGVMLAGMSVGNSGGNGTQGDGRPPRQGERKQASVAPATVPEVRVKPGNFGVAGRSLDLFV